MCALGHMTVLQGLPGNMAGRSHLVLGDTTKYPADFIGEGFRAGSRIKIHLPQISTKIDYR